MKLRYLLLTVLLGVLPVASSQAYVNLSIDVAPPLLPVYAQPSCPVDGYLWTPGYWAYDNYDGYYWVPGVWVAPPVIGYLWTPGYWGYSNGLYAFNQGYWGPSVGFYGGVNYGYGYGGIGYYGGRWENRVFRYNTAVTRVNTSVIHNTYVNRTALSRQATVSRASFNGPGGSTAWATPGQLAAARGPHLAPTGAAGPVGRRPCAPQCLTARPARPPGQPAPPVPPARTPAPALPTSTASPSPARVLPMRAGRRSGSLPLVRRPRPGPSTVPAGAPDGPFPQQTRPQPRQTRPQPPQGGGQKQGKGNQGQPHP